jgi:methylmalonyl-CoA mutase
MKNFELNEFPKVSHQEWQEKIITDLRGKELESLNKTTQDEIVIQPHYSSKTGPNKGFQRFVHESVKSSYTRESWYINQEFNCRKPIEANTRILQALDAGVDSIKISVPSEIKFGVLFKDVLPEHIEIRFKNATTDLIYNYFQWAQDKGYDTTKFEGTFEVFYHRIESLDERIELAEKVLEYFPKMSMLNVNGDYFFNQGSTNIQQLAISLSLANELLEELVDNDIPAQKAANLISFSLATGSDFFSEIAKYRAFKALWKIVLKEYGIENHATKVQGITSTWTQTVLDLNNNMLRSSTQALSAVLGGCQTVTVTPFDASVRWANNFSDRMARNTQIILRDEAFAGKVMDVASGSYFIENLTVEIAEKTWKLFLEIEDFGGFKENMDNGTITKWIKESREKAWEKAKSGETTVLGVNKYPNAMEDKDALFTEKKKSKIRGLKLSDAINQ